MRFLAILLVVLVLAACSTAPSTSVDSAAGSPAQEASIDPIVEFLLTSAATDFHSHRPPDPARFRNVRLGYMMTPGGEKQYMLCGQFLPAKGEGNAAWTPFATIKTSGYEQWLGSQAASFCQQSSVGWAEGDFSASLQSRLDSLR